MLANFSDFWILNFKRELAALCVAFLWALTSVIYSHLGKKIFPQVMNLNKGAITIAMAFFTIFLSGKQLLPAIDSVPFVLLLLSGAVGIGIGDTAYFAALNSLGARRTLLLKTLDPPMAAIVSAIFLQEQLASVVWVGILLTILGVAWVISERVKNVTSNDKLIVGVSFALLSAFTYRCNGCSFIPCGVCSDKYRLSMEYYGAASGWGIDTAAMAASEARTSPHVIKGIAVWEGIGHCCLISLFKYLLGLLATTNLP